MFPSIAQPKGDGPVSVETARQKQWRATAHRMLDELIDGGSLRGTHGTLAVGLTFVDGSITEVYRDIRDRRRNAEDG